MPSLQQLARDSPDWLVLRLISFRDSCQGKYRTDFLAVSHRWESPTEPDPNGEQSETRGMRTHAAAALQTVSGPHSLRHIVNRPPTTLARVVSADWVRIPPIQTPPCSNPTCSYPACSNPTLFISHPVHTPPCSYPTLFKSHPSQ